jgi:imidazolonepropionase-like amidohydrolase
LAAKPQASQTGGERNLRLEALCEVLDGKVPLLITVNHAQDIASALRLAQEFNIPMILDSASEAYMMIAQIKAANVPVIIHPTMARAFGEMQNMSTQTCAKLLEAGILVSMQSGYETYVPKSRVVLLEAAIAAANGCGIEGALKTVTTGPATILGVQDRIGSLKVGLDGDIAIFDGDPFEYTTHCTATIINGEVFQGR